MRRRGRLLALVGLGAVVLAIGGGFAFFALGGDDAPPVPRLTGDRLGTVPSGRWTVCPSSSTFAGYRVDERYLGVGVRTAVGRTPAVSGAVTVRGRRLLQARLHADLRRLRSDQARRDRALRTRAIETDAYPVARFALTAPVALVAHGARGRGALVLHGRRAPIAVTVAAARAGRRLELVGRAPIRLAAFAIEPPSVAGVVTVSDHGSLEFRLVLVPERTAC